MLEASSLGHELTLLTLWSSALRRRCLWTDWLVGGFAFMAPLGEALD